MLTNLRYFECADNFYDTGVLMSLTCLTGVELQWTMPDAVQLMAHPSLRTLHLMMGDMHFDDVRAVPRSDMRSFKCSVEGVHLGGLDLGGLDSSIRCVRYMSCMRELRVVDLRWEWTLGCFESLSVVLPRCAHLTDVTVGPGRRDGASIENGTMSLCTALRGHPTLRCLTVLFELSVRRQAILKAICPVTKFL